MNRKLFVTTIAVVSLITATGWLASGSGSTHSNSLLAVGGQLAPWGVLLSVTGAMDPAGFLPATPCIGTVQIAQGPGVDPIGVISA